MQPVITTYSGKDICPLNIQPEEIDVEDIARSLSNTCRFGGQLKYFYSVAQHSVICHNTAKRLFEDEKLAMACLLHDLGETYINDVPTPIKGNMVVSTLPEGKIVSIQELEDNILRRFNEKFNLDLDFWDRRVHYVDKVVLNTESYCLRGFKIFENEYPVLNEDIDPMPPKIAYKLFTGVLSNYDLL